MANRVPIPPGLRLAVFDRDGWKCRYCHDQEGPFHLDHVIPWSKGGPTDLGNLVTACAPCNLAKHDSTWEVPTISEVATLTPRRELIRQALQRQATLERLAAELGHSARWRPCSRKRMYWKCTCGQQGTYRRSYASGLPRKVRWHLLEAIGASLEMQDDDYVPDTPMFMES